MSGQQILYAINMFFNIYVYMIVIRCLLTWFPGVDWENPIMSAFKQSVDIYLNLFKKFIPLVGPFDLSPIVAMFALFFIQVIVVNIFANLLGFLGMLG